MGVIYAIQHNVTKKMYIGQTMAWDESGNFIGYHVPEAVVNE